MNSSNFSGSVLIKLVSHKVFTPLAFATIAYVVLSAAALYLAESGVNPHLESAADALLWVVSSIPFFGRLTTEPVSLGGTIVAIVVHVIGFLLFCVWTALAGLAIFGERKS